MTDRSATDFSAADRARESALDRIDRTEHRYKGAFYGAVAFEALFIAAFLFLADLGERTHVLILLAAVGVYGIVGLAGPLIGLVLLAGAVHVIWRAVTLLTAPGVPRFFGSSSRCEYG